MQRRIDQHRIPISIRDWALLPLRLVIGCGFMAHGMAKLFRGPENFGKLLRLIGTPLPATMAWIATVTKSPTVHLASATAPTG